MLIFSLHYSMEVFSLDFHCSAIPLLIKVSFGAVRCSCIYMQPNVAEAMENVKPKKYRLIPQRITHCSWQNLNSVIGKIERCDLQKKPMKCSLRQTPNKNTASNESQIDDGIEKREVNAEKILQLFFKGSREWNTPACW